MTSGITNTTNDRSPELEIYIHARNTNLLWRYEILTHNNLDPNALINEMEDDIFWDLAEIDRDTSITRSLRLTNMGIETLPENLTIPFSAKILDVSNNKLDKIPESWFDHMENLEILRIANNQFEKLNWEALSKLSSIKILDFRGNPWQKEFVDKFKSYVKVFNQHIRKIYW